MTNFTVMFTAPLISLWGSTPGEAFPVLLVRVKGMKDLAFYEERKWNYSVGLVCSKEHYLPPHVVLRTKKEVNAALEQAELTHRLSR